VPLPLLLLALLATLPRAFAAESAPAVPRGEVRTGTFAASRIYPGTTREYQVYVPAQYDPARPACLLVCFDGAGFFTPKGALKLPAVLDELIARREIPVLIAVGVNPGVVPSAEPGAPPRNHRSLEYDSLGDTNARFLLEDVTADPAGRAVAGNSSGAIAAFTVAWERPDQFRKVISHIGSYTNIRGGYAYPGIIRQTKPAKPLRVFLQEGVNDLDNLHGNWPLANRELAAALAFAGYDHRLVLGDGGHSAQHGGSIFADTLRWLWRDWPQP
jgi:enterochelin esterase family protein